ncbi:hypothetical protein J437_LFUL013394 [Ladona fulva]|uniref:Uncharacterized protein n=1 Tax=Ladona fulva TaxID=123851 RepID=A0A8K0KDZ4_LADFU|nr:hypothetical protein J437_LFUL013394 [Ladona fulva]
MSKQNIKIAMQYTSSLQPSQLELFSLTELAGVTAHPQVLSFADLADGPALSLLRITKDKSSTGAEIPSSKRFYLMELSLASIAMF